ncbi:hypothetical protein MMC09_005599 [Bachmanniomyces sp. S44760]|nr:hypothetical protein [Bachmanniomyces sp. S44760]
MDTSEGNKDWGCEGKEKIRTASSHYQRNHDPSPCPRELIDVETCTGQKEHDEDDSGGKGRVVAVEHPFGGIVGGRHVMKRTREYDADRYLGDGRVEDETDDLIGVLSSDKVLLLSNETSMPRKRKRKRKGKGKGKGKVEWEEEGVGERGVEEEEKEEDEERYRSQHQEHLPSTSS